ncbi:conserved hypothetical protein [Hyella patelloides LEGE 07179]|uniref:Uncharacterized protein n=1 Tax=Hyella patelloides LEGE 07179 TaxID=945734 RepID=A0A563W0Q3_9CYAN|nr:CHAT domain-containing protein [Hyella patelloides]VEP17278.1 conserved hypothetical protein [Hyella patelloides LEGE 07179]
MMQITQRLNDTLSALPSISNELVDTLDWAWLVDFGQGNFAHAQAKIEIALLGEWNLSNVLARALVHQLQGEYNQAISLLEKAFLRESEDKNKLIIATIAYLTERKAKENLADGFSLSATKTETDTLWKQRTQVLKQEIQDLEYRLEINLIQQIAAILPCWRTTIAKQTDDSKQEKYQELILEKLTKQLEIYQGQSYYAIAEFLYCCFAELLALSGQFVAGWQLLEQLAPAYLNSEKYLETAWYLMCQGDLIMETAPFGKPIVFGYRLIENNLDCTTIKLLDRSTIDTAFAQQQYLQARQYFSKASAPRGEAMATMRLAYVNAVQEQWYLAACGYEEAHKIFINLGDRLNAIAAEMGYLWSFLQYEALEAELFKNLQHSANWMFDNGTATFAMSWLLVFTAAAQEVLPQENGVVVSKKLIKIAEIIATKAIDIKIVFSSVSCSQFWQHCHAVISDFYRNLALELAQKNDWQQAFIAAEKVKIHGIHSQHRSASQALYLEAQLNSVIPLEKIATFLPLNTVLLSFLTTSTKLLSWAITNKGLVKSNILDKIDGEKFQIKKLEQVINARLNSLVDFNLDSQPTKILEQILLNPFTSEIETNKHLVITTCDRLRGLSFAALKYHYSVNANILKKEASLGEEKSISYLFYASQLADCQLTATATNKVLIFTEDGNLIRHQTNQQLHSNSSCLSLSQGLAIAIAQIYNIHPLNNLNQISAKILKLIDFKPVIHLFLSETNLLLNKLIQQNITSELVILSIRDFKIKQLPSKQLTNLSQSIINTGAKTVVTIFDGEDSLATAILTSFFHQGLYFGQSVAEALRQAQKQLRLVTAQEALDFCHYLQSHIPWQTESDRALRALITKYIGDVMTLGQDYYRATEAYEVAIKILESVGYKTEAKSLQKNYKILKSLQKTSKKFQAEHLIFDSPGYWNNAYIYGDWQLSFVGL